MSKNSSFNLSIPIKEYRKNKGLTQKEIAKLIGIGVATFKKIENNNHIPSIEILKKILKLKGLRKETRETINKIITEKSKNSLTYKKIDNLEIEKLLVLYNATLLKEFRQNFWVPSLDEKINLNNVNIMLNDYETVNEIAKLIFKFNKEINSIFSELDLLLSTNKIDNNLKLKYGLKNIADNLIKMSNKLYLYINENEEKIIDMEVK